MQKILYLLAITCVISQQYCAHWKNTSKYQQSNPKWRQRDKKQAIKFSLKKQKEMNALKMAKNLESVAIITSLALLLNNVRSKSARQLQKKQNQKYHLQLHSNDHENRYLGLNNAESESVPNASNNGNDDCANMTQCPRNSLCGNQRIESRGWTCVTLPGLPPTICSYECEG